jgi:choline dehydrogenase
LFACSLKLLNRADGPSRPTGGSMADDIFDYVVVGAGSAGCVLADKLSADGRSRVLVLEAGGSDRRPWIKLPIGYGISFHDPRVNWRFRTEADEGLLGRESYWPRGKVLGGSSSINAMVYCRGLPGDYDDWRDAGNPGWGWSDVEPVFRRFERHVGPDGTVRGDGPLWVCDREPEYHPLKRHFYAAAQELGLPRVDLNGPCPEGVGPYAINTRKGLRWSAADAFLRPALKRPNVELQTGVLVERVLFEGRRAVGVAYRRGGVAETARCRGAVVLAAGAVNSPRLLQLSGIGPGALLAGHGLEVRHDNPAVGGHLQDHLAVSYFFRATEPTLNAVLGSWHGRLRAGLDFLIRRKGALSLSVNQMGALLRSAPDVPRPDMQLYFNPLSYSTEYRGRRVMLKPDPFPGFILGFNACRPTSTGRIDIASPDPQAAPHIAPHYLSTNRDLADAVAGARLVGRFMATRALQGAVASARGPDLLAASDEAVLQDFRERSGTVYHPCGTCRMAPQDQGGVVGPDCAVHGVEGLRVADASIFPNITSANTNAPTILVGHMAAAAILGRPATAL